MTRFATEELRKLVEMRQPGQFTYEANRNYDSKRGSPIQGHVITYTPDPKKNADGTTSYGWIFPCLVATDLLSDAATVLESVAKQLNAAPQLAAEVLELRHVLQRLVDNLDEGDFISTTRIDEARAALSPAPVMDAVKQGDA